jgi:hypothetical protein
VVKKISMLYITYTLLKYCFICCRCTLHIMHVYYTCIIHILLHISSHILYLYMYIYIYIYICMYIQLYTYAYLHPYTYACLFSYTHIYSHLYGRITFHMFRNQEDSTKKDYEYIVECIQ